MMQRLIAEDFSAELFALRKEPGRLTDFQEWVRSNKAALSAQISPGVFIKLSRGDLAKVMAVTSELLPSCRNCECIWHRGLFESRLEHAGCTANVERAIASGILQRVKRPGWAVWDNSQLGVDGYFKCEICEALWTLVEPERQDNGLWERLA